MRSRRPRALLAALVVVVATAALTACGAAAPPERGLPPVGARFDYQLGGPYPPEPDVRIVTRDWHVKPAAGVYDICYVDAFQTQPEAESWWRRTHPDLLLRIDGAPVEDPNWPGQYLLDTSTAGSRQRLAAIEEPWIASCARKGFDAVELDNLDSWYRSSEHLTTDDNLALAKRLVRFAHDRGLAVAQKNGAVLDGRGRRVAGFDFAVAESCEVYAECDRYTRAYGRRVIEIEYTDSGDDPFRRACAARGDSISVIQRDRLVVPRGHPDYRYAAC